jgi:hypothetical protein
MLSRRCWCIGLLSFAATLCAQTELAARYQSDLSSRYQLFGGYSYFSNSINGVSGSRQPLNGYEVAFAIPPWHNLRYKMSVIQYRGTNLGAVEHPYFVMAGGQYGTNIRREAVFVEALAGVGNVNADWGENKTIGQTASFSAILGGGFDTPLTRQFALRVQGGYQYAYFKQVVSRNINGVPIYVPGLPTNFARFSSGLVWRF